MLDPLPAREARHHGQRAGVDRRGITHGVLRDQLLLVDLGVALILALERPAIGKEMLGGRGNVLRIDALSRHERPLQPEHHRLRIIGRSEEHASELQSLMRTSYAVFCLTKTTTNTSVMNIK